MSARASPWAEDRRQPVSGQYTTAILCDAHLGATHGSFRVFLLCDFRRNICAGQGTAVYVQAHANRLRHESDALLADVHALCAAYRTCIRHNLARQLVAHSRDELVGQDENEYGGVLARVDKIGIRDDVRGQGDAWQVLDILVELVEELRELLRLRCELGASVVMARLLGDGNLLFVHPHVYLLFEKGGVRGSVLGDKLGHGGAPWSMSANARLTCVNSMAP